MEYFELALALLFVLAVVDLSIGVSNDAVNFLNSAIGSRVASRRVILAVAGCGVLAGSLFSSGIMEVARSGIFNPELFVFADVMVIFLAVMLADVLLLDLFNTFALPTSTTVSIVFELLGASVALAFIATLGNAEAASVIDYVNVRGAVLIVSGIGISVVIAFAAGTAVQFVSRMLFTFQEKNHTDAIRIGWSAIAFTIISYFLLIKGLKGASFVPPESLAFILDNALWVTAGSLIAWSIVMAGLNRFRVDVLSIVVLGGTFSLALAFASNDLVNFIGVPLAGLSSWQAWSGSGLDADAMKMAVLAEPVQGNSLLLLAAGGVMVTTLWLSSKARSVTQTEVNLGRQDDGAERFTPGPVSRGIVRSVMAAGDAAGRAVPGQWRTGLARRFERERRQSFDLDAPAFDTLRASVNLTVASILIVFATSLKLPLSTTFVSFMVAMGTSLADRAWGRDSAAYRVAGVLSVVGGWFVTALCAFLMAATFATLIRLFDGYAVGALAAAAAFALVHTYRYHARRSRMEQMMRLASPDSMDRDSLVLRKHFVESLRYNAAVLDDVINALVKRKRKLAKKLRATLQADIDVTRKTEAEFVRRLNRVKPRIEPWLLGQLDFLACERDLLQSSTTLTELAAEHVLNEHSPPSAEVQACLLTLKDLFRESIALQTDGPVETDTRHQGSPIPAIDKAIDRLTEQILEDLYSGRTSTRNTTLMLGIALEMRDLNRELERSAAAA